MKKILKIIGCIVAVLFVIGIITGGSDGTEKKNQKSVVEEQLESAEVSKSIIKQDEETLKNETTEERETEQEAVAPAESVENEEDQESNAEKSTESEFMFPDSDKRYLSAEEVCAIGTELLYIGRNEIYARHGYIFKSKDLQKYFEDTSWYEGTMTGDQFDGDKEFNDFEKKNIELIKRVEEGDIELGTDDYETDDYETDDYETDDSTEFEQIQNAIDAANKVDMETIFRSPSMYDNTDVCIKASLYEDGFFNSFYIGIAGEHIRIFPSITVDEKGNHIEKLLVSDKVAVIGTFKYHDYCHEYTKEIESTIDDAIVVLLND